MTSPTDASELSPRLIFHRLSMDERKVEFFTSHGIDVVRTRSPENLKEALEHPGLCVVVVDLSSGGQAPEKAFELIAEANASGRPVPIELLGCSLQRGNSPLRRAGKLGLKLFYMWPEGVFSELVRRLGMDPQIEITRAAERASVHRALGRSPGYLNGKILNVSRTGAMVETKEALVLGAEVFLLLALTRDAPAHSIQVRVCWVEPWGQAFRTGLQFVAGLTPEDEQRIDAYVKSRNTIDVEAAAAARNPRPSKPRGRKVKVRALNDTRVDYMFFERYRLTPKRDMELPYRRGQKLEVRFLDGKGESITVEVTGHEPPRPGQPNGAVSLRVRDLSKRPTAHQNHRQGDDHH